jgi:glutaminase
MAFVECARSADAWTEAAAPCLELPLNAYASFRKSHPASGERIMRNLAALLARRLVLANAKVDLLSAY